MRLLPSSRRREPLADWTFSRTTTVVTHPLSSEEQSPRHPSEQSAVPETEYSISLGHKTSTRVSKAHRNRRKKRSRLAASAPRAPLASSAVSFHSLPSSATSAHDLPTSAHNRSTSTNSLPNPPQPVARDPSSSRSRSHSVFAYFKSTSLARRNVVSLKGKERADDFDRDLEMGHVVSPALLLLTEPEPVARSSSIPNGRVPLESISKIASQKRAYDKSRLLDLQRIVQLGYDDELKRDFDLLSLCSITMSSIGFLPGKQKGNLYLLVPSIDTLPAGVFFNVFAAFDAGGSGMLAFAWPISGMFMCILCASLAEL
jgi:hypothetical protein